MIKEQIVYQIKRHPSIFSNRFSVLHHFFCVNGNGLEWVNGELIDPYIREDERSFNPYKTDEDVAKERDNVIRHLTREDEDEFDKIFASDDTWKDVLTMEEMIDFCMEFTLKWFLKNNLEIDYIINNAETLAEKSTSMKRKNIYPICNYAQMCNVPDDIQEGWLEAVYEAIEMVLDTEVNDKYSVDEKASNDAYAVKVKADLNKRFGLYGVCGEIGYTR